MQTLWSRAARTASCRCSTCIASGTTTLARRTTTAPTRRKVTTTEIFTAFYSAIFATATIIDSQRKDARRQDWDRAIDEVRSELEALKSEEQTDQNEGRASVGLQELSERQQFLRRSQDTPFAHTSRIITAANAAKISSTSHQVIEDVSPIDDDILLYVQGELKYHHKQRERNPTHLRHIVCLQHRISSLVDRLLSAHRSDALYHSRTDAYATAIQKARSRGIQLPFYTRWTAPETSQLQEEMNETIDGIFARCTPEDGDVGYFMVMLCYKLLMSTVPPNVDTYTLMIRHLTRFKQHTLAQIIIESFFEQKYKADSRFCAACIDLYMSAEKYSLLNRFLRRMQGEFDGRDMSIQRRFLDDISSPQEQAWASSNRVTRSEDAIHEKVIPDRYLYTTIIRSFLDRGKIRQAIQYTREAFISGSRIDNDLLIEVLKGLLSIHKIPYTNKDVHSILHRWQNPLLIFNLVSYGAVRHALGELLKISGVVVKSNGWIQFTKQHSRPCDITRLGRQLRLASLHHKVSRSEEKLSRIAIAIARHGTLELRESLGNWISHGYERETRTLLRYYEEQMKLLVSQFRQLSSDFCELVLQRMTPDEIFDFQKTKKFLEGIPEDQILASMYTRSSSHPEGLRLIDQSHVKRNPVTGVQDLEGWSDWVGQMIIKRSPQRRARMVGTMAGDGGNKVSRSSQIPEATASRRRERQLPSEQHFLDKTPRSITGPYPVPDRRQTTLATASLPQDRSDVISVKAALLGCYPQQPAAASLPPGPVSLFIHRAPTLQGHFD